MRLRWLLAALWISSIAGAVVIAALSLGWVGWAPFIVAGLVGGVLGWPAAILNARYLRRHP